MKKVLRFIIKFFAFFGIFLIMSLATLYCVMLLICYGPSESARDTFVTTFLETGQLKFVVKLVMSHSKVEEIVANNSLETLDGDVNSSLIKAESTSDEIEIKKISGSNFVGTLMIVHDPKRIKVATTYPFSEYGKNLDEIVKEANAIGGINGGIYQSTLNKGGYPMGLVVSDGKIVWNENSHNGYYLIGFDEDNVLKIISLVGKTKEEIKTLVENEKIRDCVTFQEEANGDNNHFVKLIINGEKREVKGAGSGANPRTAIGQRADGTVLMLVTDGRGSAGHLGATAQDLIDIMSEYGAVNAANLDGGSSSTMYYQDKYLMTSVTMYYSNASWRLPEAFIITK